MRAVASAAACALACGSLQAGTVVVELIEFAGAAGSLVPSPLLVAYPWTEAASLPAAVADDVIVEGAPASPASAEEVATPVPEMHTWSLMAGGLGMVVFLARRRLSG